jgi:hypothetical protein
MTTAADLLREMQSFVHVPSTIITEAEITSMNTENSIEFQQLVKDWCEGIYDEDPNEVVNEIDRLLD